MHAHSILCPEPSTLNPKLLILQTLAEAEAVSNLPPAKLAPLAGAPSVATLATNSPRFITVGAILH